MRGAPCSAKRRASDKDLPVQNLKLRLFEFLLTSDGMMVQQKYSFCGSF